MPSAPDAASEAPDAAAKQPAKTICGIIMPISGTANQPETHWTAVRTLIARAIEKAGFEAIPVWENSATDRVSERIIGNIFQFPLAVVDISDSNPNVMLELGLRLASKRPTVVVINQGGSIPFDIRDFHALHYPSSLSILEMEAFIDELASTLITKNDAASKTDYIPFLGNVVVDVIAPSQREIPLGEFLLERLDEISAKLSHSPKHSSGTAVTTVTSGKGQTTTISNTQGTAIFFTCREDATELLTNELQLINRKAAVYLIGGSNNRFYYAVVFKDWQGSSSAQQLSMQVASFIAPLDGRLGVPDEIATMSKIF